MTKKRIVASAISIAATVILVAAAVLCVRFVQAEDMIHSTQSEPVNADRYYIKSAGDTVGVYERGGTLIYVLDVVPSTLPEADQQSLANGIPVKDEKALKQLIEDLTS